MKRFHILPCRSAQPLLILSGSLPAGTAGIAYSTALAATGGVPPYTWSLVSASPNTGAWIAVSAAGVLSGTPSASETETIVVRVTDSQGTSTTGTLSLVVVASGGTTLTHNVNFTLNVPGIGGKSRSNTLIVDDYGQDGVGNVNAGYAGVAPNWSYPGFTNNNAFNRATNFVTPDGYSFGVPHPFVQAILAGAHYNGQASTSDSAWFRASVKYPGAIPSFPFIIYIAYWKVASRNWSFTPGESTNDHNYKHLSWGTSSDLLNTSKFTSFQPGSPASNATQSVLSPMGDNGHAQQIPDRNGNNQYGAPGSGGSGYHEPSPFDGVWRHHQLEICFDSNTSLTTGQGFMKKWCNGVPIANYAGCTDDLTGTARIVNVGGIFVRDYGPGFTNNTAAAANWEAIAGLTADATGGGVGGACLRVLLGDQPTFAASTQLSHCPIQNIADPTVIPQCRKGPFATGQTVYAHALNEAGTVFNNCNPGPFTMS